MNINIFIPWHILRLGGLWLHTSLPSRSTSHILAPAKVQWTSKQLKSAYLDFQSFHRRSSKFPAEHLLLLLEWFTLFFVAIIVLNSFCTVFWVSSFYLSVNIVVLYQFMVTRIEKVEAWGLSDGKRFKIAITSMFSGREDVPQKKGMDLWKQMSSKCSFTCICGIVFPLNPSATTVYARSAFYPNLRFTLSLQSAFSLSLHFTPGPQSAVCSPQSAFYTDRFLNSCLSYYTEEVGEANCWICGSSNKILY